MSTTRRWPEIIGYGNERLHTTVLEELLRDDRLGPRVAAGLLANGPHPPEQIHSVTEPKREPKTVGRLRADLQFTVNGTLTVLVETKVDSVPTREQLAAMLPPDSPNRGVALVVGYGDLLCPAERLTLAPGWSVVTLPDWSALLNDLGRPLPGDLEAYGAAVNEECEQRQTVLAEARRGRWPRSDLGTASWRHAEWGLNVAWLAAVRQVLGESDPGWITSGWTRDNVNGVQVGREFDGWRIDDDRGHVNVFFEVIANHDARWLAVKVGGATADYRRRLETAAIADRVQGDGWKAGRRPNERYRTNTIATLELGPHHPAAAASLVLDARTRFDATVVAALKAVQL